MAKRIRLEQWNERPLQIKPGKEDVLREIERRPAEFTLWDNGAVQDS